MKARLYMVSPYEHTKAVKISPKSTGDTYSMFLKKISCLPHADHMVIWSRDS